jgi:hypothetical protein
MSPNQRKIILEFLGPDMAEPSEDRLVEIAHQVSLSTYQVRRFIREEREREQRRLYYRRHKRRGEVQDTVALPIEEEIPASAPPTVREYKFKEPIVPEMPANAPVAAEYFLDPDQPAARRRAGGGKPRSKRARRDEPIQGALEEPASQIELPISTGNITLHYLFFKKSLFSQSYLLRTGDAMDAEVEGEDELHAALPPISGAVPLRPIWTDQEDTQLLRQYASNLHDGKVNWTVVAGAFRKNPLSCQRRFKKLMEFPHCR